MSGMSNVFKGLRKQFLRRRDISIHSRLNVVKMALLSRGLYNAATWPRLYAAELDRVHKRVMQVYETVFDDGYSPGRHIPHEHILQQPDVLAPFILLLYLRMSLFVRVCCRALGILFDVLVAGADARRSWLAAVRADLRLL
eukprot:6496805-Karenia_brevis.AAC.1